MSRKTGIATSHKIEFTHKLSLRSLRKEWRWRIVSESNLGREIIGASTEGYLDKKDAIYNLQSISSSVDNYFDVINESFTKDPIKREFDYLKS